MQTFFFLILLFLIYLGLFAGSIISYYAKEELEPGKKYLKMLKSVIASIILSLFLGYLKLSIPLAFTISAMIAYIVFRWEDSFSIISSDTLYYCFFSVVFFETQDASPVYSVLIFMYGIVAASLAYNGKKGAFTSRALSILSGNLIYLLVSISFMIAFRK